MIRLLYFLLFSLLCITAIAFVLLNRDLLAPGFIVCLVFVFSTLCCIYNSKYWKTSLGLETYFVIIGGCLIFVVVSCLVQEVVKGRLGTCKSRETYDLKILTVPKHKVWMVVLIDAFLILMQIRFVRYVVGFSSSDNLVTWALKMEYYRNVVSYDTSGLHITLPSYITIPLKICTIFAYVFLYICVNDFLASNEKIIIKRFRLLDTLPIVLYIIYNLVAATRGSILTIFIAGIVIFHLLYHKKYGWNKRYSLKMLLKFMLLAVLILAVFILLRDVVGRRYSETAADPLYYICCYAGGSIHLLDDFIKNPPTPSNIWGKETFYSFIRFFGSHFDIDDWMYVSHFEYRMANGLNVGNVYSAFRKYIYDFGYLGVIWCTATVSLIYSILYYNIKYKRKKNRCIDIPILYFGYIAYGYFYMSIQEQPLSTILCTTTIVMPLLYKCVEYWLFRIHFKFFRATSTRVVVR